MSDTGVVCAWCLTDGGCVCWTKVHYRQLMELRVDIEALREEVQGLREENDKIRETLAEASRACKRTINHWVLEMDEIQ